LRKAWAEAGDIVLLFADESEALTHPCLARAWAKRGADLRVPAPGQSKKIPMMGALDRAARRLIVHSSPTKHSADFIALPCACPPEPREVPPSTPALCRLPASFAWPDAGCQLDQLPVHNRVKFVP
jgi:hypothetical protein